MVGELPAACRGLQLLFRSLEVQERGLNFVINAGARVLRLGTPQPQLRLGLGKTAADAAARSLAEIEGFRREMFFANLTAFLATLALGFLTVRRIVRPIRALESSVTSIAAGDYDKTVPFVSASDETGRLARAVDVLKRGAAEMDEQRWVKSTVSTVTGKLQGAASLPEFGASLRELTSLRKVTKVGCGP